ncbi:unnamed protein product [Cuscuta campestris]|uniref:CCHC-type domain-containing protein n=1 Tax=Cuscuta campestris TaxID=132261 RepID=A0A484K7Z4_9ASTE|nr:unnamed protein product [Cuscuta campestris]
MHNLERWTDSSQYRLIANCTEAQKAWKILETTHEGDERVKTAKYQILMTKFENLRMEDKESITEFHGRVRDLANEAERLGRPFEEDNLVLKVLRALPESYSVDAKAIRQAHDLKRMTLDQLMGNLETIELAMSEEQNKKKTEKQIAFQVGDLDSEDDVISDDDFQEQLSLFTKQFTKRWLQKKGKQALTQDPQRSSQTRMMKEFKAQPSEPRRKGPQCFECGGFGHIQTECANNMKKKRQAFASTWSDEEPDTEDTDEESNCAFVTVEVQEDSEEQLKILQEKWSDLLDINKKNVSKNLLLKTKLQICEQTVEKLQHELSQKETENANLRHELDHHMKYQKWINKAGAGSSQEWMLSTEAKAIEHQVDISKMYGDRTRLGYPKEESTKTPLDLFIKRSDRRKGIDSLPVKAPQTTTDQEAQPEETHATENEEQVPEIATVPTHIQKNHPLKNVIGSPIEGMKTRKKAINFLEMTKAYYTSTSEPRNIKEALTDEAWINAMHEELEQFERNKEKATRGQRHLLSSSPSTNPNSLHEICSATMVRSKIAIPQKFNRSKGSKPQPSWFKKYCQVRKKLQETREDEVPVVNPGSPASIPHMQQQEDDVAHLLPSDLPQMLLIEYHKPEEEAETAEVPKSEPAPPTDEPTQPPPDAPVQEDEEFIQLLDEDPLVAVSEVPFQKEPAAKKGKKKVIPSTVPQRRSKRKLKLEEDSSLEAPPQKKQSTPMSSAADVTPVVKTGKSPHSRFVSSKARSLFSSVHKKSIIVQRRIDVEDFKLKTNLIPLLEKSKLMKSVTLQGSFVKSVICKFYCNLTESCADPADPMFHKVFLHGKTYKLSPALINTLLDLSPSKRDTKISEKIMWLDLTNGQRASQSSKAKISSSILKSSYAILLRVAALHWLPTTHTNTVSKIMARLLYTIKHNIPFDLGQLIFDQIMLFAAEKYKVNSIGLPYPTLLYSLLVSQGFSKEEEEEEELEESPLQVDSRHMEGKHHNDMEVAVPTTEKDKKTPSLVKFLEQKLMQVKEELARTSQLKEKLEIEKGHLVVLLRQAREAILDEEPTDSEEEILGSMPSDEQGSHTEGERVCVLLTYDLLVDFTGLFGFDAVGFALWFLCHVLLLSMIYACSYALHSQVYIMHKGLVTDVGTALCYTL